MNKQTFIMSTLAYLFSTLVITAFAFVGALTAIKSVTAWILVLSCSFINIVVFSLVCTKAVRGE